MAIKIVVALFLVGCALGEDAPYPPSGTKPQGALLVLPTEVGSASANRPAAQYAAPQYLTPQQQPEVIDNLKKASDNIMERLRQEQGAGSGSYYVYLADGRLQRVQYTTAPLREVAAQQTAQNVNLQNSQTVFNSNTLQFNQQNAQANSRVQAYSQEQSQRQQQYDQAYPNGGYSQQQAIGQFKQEQASGQYKQDQAIGQYKQEQASGQYRQEPTGLQYNEGAAGYQYSRQQQPLTSQYRQQPSGSQFSEEAASNQYQQRVAQLKQPTSGQFRAQQSSEEAASTQYSQQVPRQQQQPAKPEQKLSEQTQDGVSDQYSRVSVQGAPTGDSSAFAQQQQLYQLQQQNQLLYQQQQQQYVQQPLAAAPAYLASIQYTEVQPITSPIYSYSPAPLVRILRYAPNYQ